jgi:hypothetical protein
MIALLRAAVGGKATAVLAWILTIEGTSRAESLRVPADYPTINAALDASRYGDTVLVAPGTYPDFETRTGDFGIGTRTATSCAFVRDGVTLLSEAGPEQTTIRMDLDPAPTHQLAVIMAGGFPSEDTVIEGFTITGQTDQMTGLWTGEAAKVTIRNCRFVDLDNGREDAAGIFSVESPLEIVGCEFLRCVASLEAAAIRNSQSSTMIESSRFEECVGTPFVARGPGSGSARNCVFLNNSGGPPNGPGAMSLIEQIFTIEDCWFEGNFSDLSGGAISTINPAGLVMVRGNVFVNNQAAHRGGAIFWNRPRGEITGNTFYGNSAPNGSACNVIYDNNLTVSNNVFVGNTGGPALLQEGGQPAGGCELFWDNPDGDALGYVFQETDVFADPVFCDSEGGDFTVSVESPCLPENSNGCGLIGAFGEGCGFVSVDDASWADIKARYR